MRHPPATEVLQRAESAVQEDGRAALIQIVRVEGSTPGKPGWKLLVRLDGSVNGNLGGGAFEALVKADAAAKLGESHPRSELKRYYFTEKAVRGEPTGMVCGGMAEVFLEVLESEPVLLVCGGGPVGQSLARAGELAGFDVAVVEDRAEFRRSELFPPATQVIAVDRGYEGEFLASLLPRHLYVAVVTRCWETDRAALAGVLRQAPPRLRYLGLMGSRRKVERVVEELNRQGYDPAKVPLVAPIGLPIGGDTPGEIAISILAQIIEQRTAERSAASAPRLAKQAELAG